MGRWTLDVGRSTLDVGPLDVELSDFRTFGHSPLDIRRPLTLDFGRWNVTVDVGCWTFRCWTLGVGRCPFGCWTSKVGRLKIR